ncbi:hypothetical protein ACFW04_014670 [Cataglyphis niger]
METEEEMQKRYEEEERLIARYKRQSKIHAIAIERQPTEQEIEEVWLKEKQKTDQIKKLLFTTRQADVNNRNYFTKKILNNEKEDPEYQIISMITIKKLTKEIVTVNKPININHIVDGESSTVVTYLEKKDFEEEIEQSIDAQPKKILTSTKWFLRKK